MTAQSVSRRNLLYAVQLATVTAPHSFPGLLSWFLPCYQFGKNAEAVGDSCCLCGFLMCFLWWWGGTYANILTSFLRCTIRGKIRQQKGIDVSDGKPGLDLTGIVCWRRYSMYSMFFSYREAHLVTAVATTGAPSARWPRSPRSCRGSVASPWPGNSLCNVVS